MRINEIMAYLLSEPQKEAKKEFDTAVKAFRQDLDKGAAEVKLKQMNGRNGIKNGHAR